ncbi:MAG: YiiX family permuted papain-like enzyme [Flavobacteriales bacterium]|nr:YiiX family permuted papain-like enzyme [Flavobacteriales bacterium]
MAIQPVIKNMAPEKRERLAFTIVGVLAVLAVLWGINVYYLPEQRLERAKAGKAQRALLKELRNGDLIFQSSLSGQSKAIQLATRSKYSHCGLVFQADSGRREWYVLEAVQPVKWTSLADWIARGEDGHYVVKRPETEPPLDDQTLAEVRLAGEQFVGKDYDLYFDWSDERIYCSELIWKAYHQATGLELGKLQELREFDLSEPAVAEKLKERYGKKIPLDEVVISPASIFESPLLVTVATR